jgi:hypothetical protein
MVSGMEREMPCHRIYIKGLTESIVGRRYGRKQSHVFPKYALRRPRNVLECNYVDLLEAFNRVLKWH